MYQVWAFLVVGSERKRKINLFTVPCLHFKQERERWCWCQRAKVFYDSCWLGEARFVSFSTAVPESGTSYNCYCFLTPLHSSNARHASLFMKAVLCILARSHWPFQRKVLRDEVTAFGKAPICWWFQSLLPACLHSSQALWFIDNFILSLNSEKGFVWQYILHESRFGPIKNDCSHSSSLWKASF